VNVHPSTTNEPPLGTLTTLSPSTYPIHASTLRSEPGRRKSSVPSTIWVNAAALTPSSGAEVGSEVHAVAKAVVAIKRTPSPAERPPAGRIRLGTAYPVSPVRLFMVLLLVGPCPDSGRVGALPRCHVNYVTIRNGPQPNPHGVVPRRGVRMYGAPYRL
jgi:hypothetical protein